MKFGSVQILAQPGEPPASGVQDEFEARGASSGMLVARGERRAKTRASVVMMCML